jgi:hypothetical protein
MFIRERGLYDAEGRRLGSRASGEYHDTTGSTRCNPRLLEHVGPKNYATYFDTVHRTLKDDGSCCIP